MHAVEKVQRDGKIENCCPCAEAESLLFQPIVVLWPAAKGGEDPQLSEREKINLTRIHDFPATWQNPYSCKLQSDRLSPYKVAGATSFCKCRHPSDTEQH